MSDGLVDEGRNTGISLNTEQYRNCCDLMVINSAG